MHNNGGHPLAEDRAQDSESSPAKEQRSTAVPHSQPYKRVKQLRFKTIRQHSSIYLGCIAEVKRCDLRLVWSDLKKFNQVGDEVLYGEEAVVACAARRVENQREVNLAAAICFNQSP